MQAVILCVGSRAIKRNRSRALQANRVHAMMRLLTVTNQSMIEYIRDEGIDGVGRELWTTARGGKNCCSET